MNSLSTEPKELSKTKQSYRTLRTEFQKLSSTVASRLRKKLMGTSATTPDDSEEQRRQLEEECLEMSIVMKQTALNISSSLKSDDSVLARIVSQQNKGIKSLSKESKALGEVEVRSSFWNTLKSILAIVFSCVLFCVMLGFIYLFPAKSYVDKV
mmetsp:Transcript_2077/g.4780  ORF Transcript_2077/g.4780 Transcript_2077/m.4780 type:complete len:154 (-) Transcript_2077:806-1267(-)